MNFTKDEFENSEKLKKYEDEIIVYFKNDKIFKEIELQKKFKYRASLETIKNIALHSEKIGRNEDFIFDSDSFKAEINYTITGNNIQKITINGKSKRYPNNGALTMHNVMLGLDYSFKVEVDHSGGNCSFSTTNITTHNGDTLIQDQNPKIFNGSHTTITTTKAE